MRIVRAMLAMSVLLSMPVFLAACGGSDSGGSDKGGQPPPQQKVACKATGYCFEVSGTWTAAVETQLIDLCTTDVEGTPSVGACPSAAPNTRLHGYCVMNPAGLGLPPQVQSMVEYFYAPCPSAEAAQEMCEGTWHAY